MQVYLPSSHINPFCHEHPLLLALFLSHYSFIGTTPLTATAPMPGCYMRIFAGTPDDKKVAENVRIGDPLTMEISLDDQEIYGMKVTDCLVRDGLGWGEQMLINEEGYVTPPYLWYM